MPPQPSVRPNVFDWFFAFFMGLVAAVVVFSTTCFGGLAALVTLAKLFSRSSPCLLYTSDAADE